MSETKPEVYFENDEYQYLQTSTKQAEEAYAKFKRLEGANSLEDLSDTLYDLYNSVFSSKNYRITAAKRLVSEVEAELRTVDFVKNLQFTPIPPRSFRLSGRMDNLVMVDKSKYRTAVRLPPAYFEVVHGQSFRLYTKIRTGWTWSQFNSPRYFDSKNRFIHKRYTMVNPHCHAWNYHCFGDFNDALGNSRRSFDLKLYLAILKDYISSYNGYERLETVREGLMFGDPSRRMFSIYEMRQGVGIWHKGHKEYGYTKWSELYSRWGILREYERDGVLHKRFYISPNEWLPAEGVKFTDVNMDTKLNVFPSLLQPMPDVRGIVQLDPDVTNPYPLYFRRRRNYKPKKIIQPTELSNDTTVKE